MRAQLAGDVHADISGGGQPSVSVTGEGTQLGGPGQRGDTCDHVTAGKNAMGCPLERGGDVFIGLDRRLGEMPRAPVRLIGP